MKIEFQNSIIRLSFLCRVTDIKIAWINTWFLILNKFYHPWPPPDVFSRVEVTNMIKDVLQDF